MSKIINFSTGQNFDYIRKVCDTPALAQCLGTTATTATTAIVTSTTAITTATTCLQLTCLNGFIFNLATCGILKII